MIKLVGQDDEMVVLVLVGEFDVARLALDVDVALVAIVEAVGEREAVAFVDTPAHTHLGTNAGDILSVPRCAAGI